MWYLKRQMEKDMVGATVDKIDGDSIEVSNDVIGKSWTVKQSDIINISDGDFYYK